MNLGPSLMKKKARIRTKPSVTNNELAVLTPLKTPEAMAVPLSCTLVMTAWTAFVDLVVLQVQRRTLEPVLNLVDALGGLVRGARGPG